MIALSGGILVVIALLPEPMPLLLRAALIETGVLIWLMPTFRTLTVAITNEICRSFGWGWPCRRIDPAEVTGQQVVRNRWWCLWGIRGIPDGTLGHVAGLDAVELSLQNGKVFRIGTDDPDLLRIAVAGVTGRA